MAENVGFIGLGVMGGPMAANLARVYNVTVFDVSTERAKELEAVTRADSVQEVGRSCSIVCLSLPKSEAVEEVVLGPEGLRAVMARGTMILDFSTTSPTLSRRIESELKTGGIDFMDAPVSGGAQGAKEATLSIMVGGTKETFEKARPLMETVGSSVVHVGAVGTGGVAKLVNNMLVGAEFAAVAEGFALGARAGIPAGVLYDAIKGGWAASKVLDVSAPAIINKDFKPGGSVGILSKDLGYARNLAREYELPVPVTAIVDEVFTTAKAFGNTNLAQPSMVQMWERLLDIDVAAGKTGREAEE